MPSQLNIKNAESAYLSANAAFKSWMEKFLQQWTQPVQDEMAIVMWNSIPQQQKDYLEKHYPEMYAEAEEQIERFMAGG